MEKMTYNLLNLYKFTEALIEAGIIKNDFGLDNTCMSALLIDRYYPTSSEDSIKLHLQAIIRLLDESGVSY